MDHPAERFFKWKDTQFDEERCFKIHKGGELVYLARATTAPLPDLSKLPQDIVRQISTYVRSPLAECIARELFFNREPGSFTIRGTYTNGEIWKNLDNWLVFRKYRFTSQRRTDRVYKKDYGIEVREYMLVTSVTDCGRKRASGC
jgi:hypothetical protein